MPILTPHQEKALRAVSSRIKGLIQPEPLTYLGGFAGTGKSTLLPFILEDLGFLPEKVWFCAPTGKAAKIMRTKLRDQKYPNHTASTIHSAIYRAKPAPIAQLEENLMNHEEALAKTIFGIRSHNGLFMDPDAIGVPPVNLHNFPEVDRQRKLLERMKRELSEAYREDKINFQLNADSAIQLADLIVVDEASMVGRRMADDLMSFGVPILAIGDPGQLPPIEDKAGLTAGDPDAFLTEIHRQALDNPIIHLSMLAREGKNLPFGKYGETAEVVRRNTFDNPYRDMKDRPQYLCGKNITRWGANQNLREDFGFVERAGDRIGPQKGEPLSVRKNIKEYPNLVNGTSCIATSSSDLVQGEAKFSLSFEDDEGTEYLNKDVYQGMFEEHFSMKPNGFSAPERVAYRAKKNCIVMDWDFCRTVHSSQGAAYDHVVLIDESDAFRDDADRHLYTGITRAAQTIKILR